MFNVNIHKSYVSLCVPLLGPFRFSSPDTEVLSPSVRTSGDISTFWRVRLDVVIWSLNPPQHHILISGTDRLSNWTYCFCVCCWLSSRGHEAYLRTGPQYDFDHYKQLVNEITQAFNGISKEVLEIKGKLRHDFDRPDLSEHIEKLQSKEKEKLELVSVYLDARGGRKNKRQLL